MTIPVITAVTDPHWEAALIAALDRGETGVTVVRRCVDLADLLAVASTGTARAAVVSADLRGFDRDALARLAVASVAAVVLVPPGDEAAERRLRQLGVEDVLPADASPAAIVAAVTAATGRAGNRPVHDYPDARDPAAFAGVVEDELSASAQPVGRVVAVWGPTGAPGRTTVAVALAAEIAGLGTRSLLVDADVYGGVVAQALGLLDESPGIAAAARLATSGSLDAAALAELSRQVDPGFAVLTGIARADRWPELRPSALEAVLAVARRLADVVVVDCGFALEQDEELAYDTAAPRRNGATLAVLADADQMVAVGSADPISLQRLVRGLADLREAVPTSAGATPTVVVNRLRAGAVGGGDPAEQVAAALRRYAGVGTVRFVPHDVAACDAALATGRTLREAAPSSPARLALRDLAASVAGVAPPARRRRLLAGAGRSTPV